jgi:AcrR family transcriptional regulator
MSETKEFILKTAFSLFLQKSFKEVTMNEIVNATGLSKGAFYHYFKSKEMLFIEVINSFYFDKMVIDFEKLNHNSLKEFYSDYVNEVKQLIKNFKMFLNIDDAGANINYITLMFDALKLFPGFRDRIKEEQKKEMDTWTTVIKNARGKKEFCSPMSDEQIARMFIYSNDGIGLYLLLNGNFDSAYSEMLNLWDNFYKEITDCV